MAWLYCLHFGITKFLPAMRKIENKVNLILNMSLNRSGRVGTTSGDTWGEGKLILVIIYMDTFITFEKTLYAYNVSSVICI